MVLFGCLPTRCSFHVLLPSTAVESTEMIRWGWRH